MIKQLEENIESMKVLLDAVDAVKEAKQ